MVRHGATDYTQQSRYCGWRDPPLNDTGRRQAERLRECLAAREFQGAWSSDLARAAGTAEAILSGRLKEFARDERLRELNFGDWDGLTYDEICARDGERYRAWIDDPLPSVPGGEGLGDLEKRVTSFLDEIAVNTEEKKRCFLLVTHAGPIAVALCRAAGRPLSEFWGAVPPPASVSEIVLNVRGSEILTAGDVEHLEHLNG